MARQTPKKELEAIENIVRRYSGGVTARQIANDLDAMLAQRTLQYRLKQMVDSGRLIRDGGGRWAKYRLPVLQQGEERNVGLAEGEGVDEFSIPLSTQSTQIRKYIRKSSTARKPVGYNRDFLDTYRPNVSFYLSNTERAHLAEVGRSNFAMDAAGTYAKHILSRLLIDLSWNSSRLEGNTYSLLDTKRLIEFGEEAQGKNRFEAQMILNHKDAIAFLISEVDGIGFNRYTILNLHAILANNLLRDTMAVGKLRHIAIGIEKSTYHPLEVPHLIEECFDKILIKTSAIKDPFEQAFFIMTQLPYLQPFDDVNKRVSRLAANIPFIKSNLCPFSFMDVPRSIYIDAVLCIYELCRIDLLKEVFIWAYERSAARYTAVRQSLGEPDSFRLQYRSALHQIICEVIRAQMNRKTASAYIDSWIQENIARNDQAKLREVVENELLGLHEGNFARYHIRPAEFSAWRKTWL